MAARRREDASEGVLDRGEGAGGKEAVLGERGRPLERREARPGFLADDLVAAAFVAAPDGREGRFPNGGRRAAAQAHHRGGARDQPESSGADEDPDTQPHEENLTPEEASRDNPIASVAVPEGEKRRAARRDRHLDPVPAAFRGRAPEHDLVASF